MNVIIELEKNKAGKKKVSLPENRKGKQDKAHQSIPIRLQFLFAKKTQPPNMIYSRIRSEGVRTIYSCRAEARFGD